jgi:hypothetical protein
MISKWHCFSPKFKYLSDLPRINLGTIAMSSDPSAERIGKVRYLSFYLPNEDMKSPFPN